MWVTADSDGRIMTLVSNTPPLNLDQMVAAYGAGDYIWTDILGTLNTLYFDGTEVREQEPLAASWDSEEVVADGVAEIVLSGLPIPCNVSIDNQIVEVTDGSLEFNTEDPGEYVVVVDEVRFLRKEWDINAI